MSQIFQNTLIQLFASTTNNNDGNDVDDLIIILNIRINHLLCCCSFLPLHLSITIYLSCSSSFVLVSQTLPFYNVVFIGINLAMIKIKFRGAKTKQKQKKQKVNKLYTEEFLYPPGFNNSVCIYIIHNQSIRRQRQLLGIQVKLTRNI